MAIHASGEGRLSDRPQGGRWVGGLVLITIGAFMLLAQLMPGRDAGVLFLPMLGGIFLVAGLASRNVGLLIPGGILAGLGTGIYLVEGQSLFGSQLRVDGPAEAGIILVSLAGGFALISVLSVMIRSRVQVWPLIPATVLTGIGVLLMSGDQGLQALEVLGQYWPVALIGVGLLLLFKRQEA